MLQFCTVLLLLPVPRLDVEIVVEPKPTPNRVCVLPLPVRMTFLMTSFVAPSGPVAVCAQIIALDVPVFVFVNVRLRDDVPAFEPSIVTKSAPFNMRRAEALDPVIVTVALGWGLM